MNELLLSGTFRTVFKYVIVKPLLKKTPLDPNDLKNFRPISDLSFQSCWRRFSCLGYLEHLNTNTLWPWFQSAYCAHHPTETAPLWVLNDLLTASDDGQVSLLTLLDLSAAFDTIDHSILLHRLEHAYGIQKSPLSFFWSCLTERQQVVSISGYNSNPSTLLWCTPRFSSWSHAVSSVHTTTLTNHWQTISHSEFVDDSQL